MLNQSTNSETYEYKWARGADGYDLQIDYLIEGILPAKSFGVVYGPSGSYKSFFIMGLAAHIASGTQWDARKVKKTGVLYVVAEGGIGAPRRVKAWEKANLNGKTLDNFFVINEPVHIANHQSLKRLEATIKNIEATQSVKIELVIFDTLARCFNGADENSTKDMNYFISGCDMLKASMDVTVLVVHHTGKDEKGTARGSSALRAACDFEFKVSRGENSAVSPSLILSCEKMKDDQPLPDQAYNLKPTYIFTNDEGKAIYSLVVDSASSEVEQQESKKSVTLTSAQASLWEIVRSRSASGESTTREVVRDDYKALGLPMNNFSRSVQQLIDKALLEQRDGQLFCQSQSH
ncbi:helicase RepA family protein [Vibrio aestuarianus]|nr:helicase RepA family protein [Vibrio aestuarianus]